MNKKIAIYSSCTNVAAVLGFAVSLLLGSNAGGYLTASFIAFRVQGHSLRLRVR